MNSRQKKGNKTKGSSQQKGNKSKDSSKQKTNKNKDPSQHKANRNKLKSIPEDIVLVEILPRLPAKSLLRFKWVSKSWFSLISTEKFAETHHKLSLKNDNDTPLTDCNAILVSYQCGSGYILNHCLAGSLFSQSTMGVDQFESCQRMDSFQPFIVGCSNGLCCVLLQYKHFILWNPSTRKSRRLPHVSNEFEIYVTTHGFGYDESNDDYKVLARLRCQYERIFRLYSLKTNSWKTIDNFHVRCSTCEKGVLVNGKFHWVSDSYHTSVPLDWNIVSFDLRMEVGGVVEPPSFTNFIRPYQTTGVIKGCLCVMGNVREEGTEVWVMEEYGVKESWRKVFTVPYLCTCYPYKSPLCISDDRVVIGDAANTSTLHFYDPNTKKKNKSVRSLKLNVNDISQVDFCIPSLVSPFRNSESGEPK